MINCKGIDTPMSTGTKLQKVVQGELGYYLEDPSHYRSIVEGMQYLILTRPEIAFAVNKLSQYVSAHTLQYLMASKRVLRYLKSTQDYGLKFTREGSMQLTGFTDADWVCDLNGRKSIDAYCIYLGNNLISWSSKKQSVVIRSSAESKYRALAAASAELTWLQYLFTELGINCTDKPTIWCDNVSATELARNPVYHSRTKYIEIYMHFIRNKVVAGELRIQYVPSEEQVADIMTKPLSFVKFNYLRSKLNAHLCLLSLRGAVKIAHYGERSNEKQRKEKLKLKRDAEDSSSKAISSDANSAKLVSYTPEVLLLSEIYGPEVDMWAMGAIMFEMLSFGIHFPGKSSADQIYKICQLIGSPTKDSWPLGIQLASNLNWKFPQMGGVNLLAVMPSA
ncbi:hypothetical protein WN943_009437 [Citrus x changshan-huyou]